MYWDLRKDLGRDWEFCKMRSKRDYGNRNRRVNKKNYKLDNNHKKSNKPKNNNKIFKFRHLQGISSQK